jgi:arsenical pump membrane protein
MIIALNDAGISKAIGDFFGVEFATFKYGFASFFASNIINNIPMSVLFSSILSSQGANLPAIFATIVGSNLGAFFSPIGALAGIMWSNMLNEHGLKFGYLSFLRIGVTIAIPTLVVALLGLLIVL